MTTTREQAVRETIEAALVDSGASYQLLNARE